MTIIFVFLVLVLLACLLNLSREAYESIPWLEQDRADWMRCWITASEDRFKPAIEEAAQQYNAANDLVRATKRDASAWLFILKRYEPWRLKRIRTRNRKLNSSRGSTSASRSGSTA